MTHSLTREIGRDGITVNAVAPGLTVTRNMQDNPSYTEKVRSIALAAQSIKESERPEDLVGACLFLVSEGARMMTGQVLAVDGGTAVH